MAIQARSAFAPRPGPQLPLNADVVGNSDDPLGSDIALGIEERVTGIWAVCDWRGKLRVQKTSVGGSADGEMTEPAIARTVQRLARDGAGHRGAHGLQLATLLVELHRVKRHLVVRFAVQYRELLDKMLQFPKPIIAAVNGPVMAGGAGLMLASDMVIATPEARFGLPEEISG